MKNEKYPAIVEDSYFTEHHLTDKIGEGGQGFVCATENPLIVIKMVTDTNGNPISKQGNKAYFEKYTARFKNIRILPLPEAIHISIPIALLKDYAGYVMQFMEDMMPLHKLDTAELPASVSKYPVWLTGENFSGEITEAQKMLYAYSKNGGLRKRLLILGKAVQIIAELHSAGLVYGDVSHNNIFVTNDAEFENPNIWFIDADTLCLASEDPQEGNSVYTPQYGAPEIVLRRSVCTQASDIYAFALTAFEKLTLVYPFLRSETDAWDDWDDSVSAGGACGFPSGTDFEGKAAQGELDWIWAPNSVHATANGLPKELTLSTKLFRLFEKTFCEGTYTPEARPPALVWVSAFFEAYSMTIQCRQCGMSWYFSEKEPHICPYCSTLVHTIIAVQENRRNLFAHEMRCGAETTLYKGLFGYCPVYEMYHPALTVKAAAEEDVLTINLHDDMFSGCTVIQRKAAKTVLGSITIPFEDFTLIFGTDTQVRTLSFLVYSV